MRQKILKVCVVILCLLCGIAACKNDNTVVEEDLAPVESVKSDPAEEDAACKNDKESGENGETVEEKKTVKRIYVYVCGAVRNPGVYEMTEGDRVTHAIMKAGGSTDEAAADFLNQAAVLEDGQKIYVPTEEEAEQFEQNGLTGGENGPATEPDSGKININTASKEELMTLKGIGESRADDIIAFRKSNGGFKNVEDIKKIEGIKDKLFQQIEDQITVK